MNNDIDPDINPDNVNAGLIAAIDFLTIEVWPQEFARLTGRLTPGWHFIRWTPPSLLGLTQGNAGTIVRGVAPSPFYLEAEYFKLGNHPVTIWDATGGVKTDLHWSRCIVEHVPRHDAEFFVCNPTDPGSEFCAVIQETFTGLEKELIGQGGVYLRRVDLDFPFDHHVELADKIRGRVAAYFANQWSDEMT